MIHCIPNIKELDKYLEFSEKYHAAFEYNEFFIPDLLDDQEKCKELLHIYKECGHNRTRDTLHGVFFDIHVHSSDPKIREIADYRIHQSMEIAMNLGVHGVVFHTNTIPQLRTISYENLWLDKNVEYWNKLLEEYKEVNVYIENMFDVNPYLLAYLAQQMKVQERFGICLDIAHANISGTPIEEWVTQLAPYIKHLHINNNDGKCDTHDSIHQGTIPWENFNRWIEKMTNEPTALIEVTGYDKLIQSYRYMMEQKLYPIR